MTRHTLAGTSAKQSSRANIYQNSSPGSTPIRTAQTSRPPPPPLLRFSTQNRLFLPPIYLQSATRLSVLIPTVTIQSLCFSSPTRFRSTRTWDTYPRIHHLNLHSTRAYPEGYCFQLLNHSTARK